MSAIKCTVSNCRYWEDNECKAPSIEVNVDDHIQEAFHSEETQCHTFKA